MNNFFLKNRKTLILSILFIISGCSISPPKPGITTTVGGIKIYSNTADLQSSFLKSSNSSEHFCDSRIADTVDTASNSIGLGASFAGKDESVSEGSSRNAIALGGRSPAVLITREVMYRTCEMIMNLGLSKEEALALYIQTLNLVISVSQEDTNNGTSSIASSIAAPIQNTNSTPAAQTRRDDSSSDDPDS